MELGLESKVALVAAASQGIGKAVAGALHSEGARVAICARSEARLQDARRDIEARSGREVLAVCADVSDGGQLQALVEQVQQHWGAIDILVNNAGGPPAGSHEDIADAEWARAFELTVRSAGRLTDRVLPAMKARGWGRIINISSYSVKQPLPGMLLSNSLRLAVLGWAKTLASELAPYGVLVNTVCPGWVATRRVDELLQARAQQQSTTVAALRQKICDGIPVGRLGRTEEIANTVVFLASQAASYITGSAIAVDGGAAQVF